MAALSISSRQGMALIVVASFCFGVMGLLVKMATATIPAAQVIFIRSVAGAMIIALPVMLKLLPLRFVNLQLLTLRGIFGGAAATLYFLSLGRIPLGTAIILNNTAPIFAALYEGLLMEERLSWKGMVALLASFAGVLMIFHPDVQAINIGSLFGLLGGMLGGGALVSVRKLRETDSAHSIFFVFSVASILFSLIPFWGSLPQRVPMTFTASEIGILVVICMVAAFAQLLFTFASKYVRASQAGTLGMSTVLFASIFAIVFLHESFSLLFLLGALLIMGSAILLMQLAPEADAPRIEPQ